MRRFLLAASAAIFFAFGTRAQQQPLPQFDITATRQLFSDGVVLMALRRHVSVKDGEYSCTGIVVAPKRVLTAAHCWKDPKAPPQVDGHDTHLVSIWIEKDLLLLDALTEPTSAIRIGRPSPGQWIFGAFRVGRAVNADATVGQVIGLDGKNLAQIRISLAIRRGMSGSGIYDQSANLVGMVIQRGVAVSGPEIRRFLQAAYVTGFIEESEKGKP